MPSLLLGEVQGAGNRYGRWALRRVPIGSKKCWTEAGGVRPRTESRHSRNYEEQSIPGMNQGEREEQLDARGECGGCQAGQLRLRRPTTGAVPLV
jgi:hypothetical protein